MKILMVHNEYKYRGGEDESAQAETEMLIAHGHLVDRYTENNHRVAEIGAIGTAVRAVWSREAYRHVSTLLAKDKYDVVHVQNFFPLISPAVLYAAADHGVATVLALRNYRLFCAAATSVRDGQACDLCVGRKLPWPAIRYGCYRDSVLQTIPVATMQAVHGALGTWARKVDRFVAPSEFTKAKFVDAGLSPDAIAIKPNFVSTTPGTDQEREGGAVYVGRLADGKGLQNLLNAWERSGVSLTLRIAGVGPLESALRERSRALRNVEFVGKLALRDTYDLIAKAEFLVFPSELEETFGRVAAEAFAHGTPVIASRIGAIPEIVDDGVTGRLVEPGDVKQLATAIASFAADEGLRRKFGRAGYRAYLENYTSVANAARLEEIYRYAIETRNGHVRVAGDPRPTAAH